MKFKKLGAKCVSVAASLCLASALVPAVAHADSTRYVTLGADLTSSQRSEVLDFFGLSESDLEDLETITVTNSDEHEYCDASIPSSVTGTRTLSCSYIQPTTSGGINVKTANLTYVTSDILYNALQTAGVENCNLVVTAPFEVSGTGALTGVFMAYKDMGYDIDSSKADTAVEEMYDTAALEDTYGDGVVEAISDVKNEVASAASDMSAEEIEEAVKDACEDNGVELSSDDLDKVSSLIEKVQDLDYSADAFSNTLSSMKDALDGATGSAGGFVEAIKSFFSNIASFFSGLFGGSGSSSADSIIDSLNTDVFSLDK